MRGRLFLLLSMLLAVLFALPAAAITLQPIPALTARVTDQTGTLTAAQKTELEQKLAALEAEKGSQIAVLLIPTTSPEAIEAYSIRVAETWKIGRAKIDDGVILLIALQDRALRIEVGYGLEGALPDVTAKRIITQIITPRFKAGDIYGGISAGVDAIARVVRGEALPAPAQTKEDEGGMPIGIMLFFSFIISGFIMRAIGSPQTAAGCGVVGAIAGTLIFSSMLWGLFFGVATFLFALMQMAQYMVGGSGFTRGGGGFFGGGRSGGSSFGGGGGGFGGGGASGRW